MNGEGYAVRLAERLREDAVGEGFWRMLQDVCEDAGWSDLARALGGLREAVEEIVAARAAIARFGLVPHRLTIRQDGSWWWRVLTRLVGHPQPVHATAHPHHNLGSLLAACSRDEENEALAPWCQGAPLADGVLVGLALHLGLDRMTAEWNGKTFSVLLADEIGAQGWLPPVQILSRAA
jgi:hypothetical protein